MFYSLWLRSLTFFFEYHSFAYFLFWLEIIANHMRITFEFMARNMWAESPDSSRSLLCFFYYSLSRDLQCSPNLRRSLGKNHNKKFIIVFLLTLKCLNYFSIELNRIRASFSRVVWLLYSRCMWIFLIKYLFSSLLNQVAVRLPLVTHSKDRLVNKLNNLWYTFIDAPAPSVESAKSIKFFVFLCSLSLSRPPPPSHLTRALADSESCFPHEQTAIIRLLCRQRAASRGRERENKLRLHLCMLSWHLRKYSA